MTGLRIAPGFEMPLDLVTEATAVVATRGAGKSSASAVFIEEAFRANVQTVVFDRTGVYWGLRSNAKGTGAGLPIYVLGGPHADVPLEHTAGVMIADLVVDSGHSFVLDLSDMSKGQATHLAANFLERIYDRKARARSTTLLIMDEAHFYAPQTPRGGFKGDSAKLMGALEDAVGLGRSRGLGVILTTQRTQSLNKAILDLIETLLVMRMLSPRARAAVKDWIQVKHEDDEQGVLASLDSLPTGTAWVWSPLRGILRKVALRRIHTFDSYKTPEPGQVLLEPTVRKELDLGALGEQMRATVERAKAEDPAELRKEIAALRRQITDLERDMAARPEVEPERIDVPVLDDEARALVERVIEQWDRAYDDAAGIVNTLRDALDRAGESPRTSPVAAPHSRRSEPPQAVVTPRSVPPAVRESRAESGDITLGKTERNILTVLAQHGTVNHGTLALLSGYSPKASTIGVSMGKLRKAGLVEPTQPYRATQAGIDALDGQVEPLPEGQALIDYWRHRFGQTERNVLDAFLAAWPNDTTQTKVAERTGYSPTASTIGVSLGKLRKVGVIDRWRISDDFANAVGLS